MGLTHVTVALKGFDAANGFGLVEIAFMGEITAGRVRFGPDAFEKDSETVMDVPYELIPNHP
jgi:DNA-binding protein YbaB